MYSSVIKFKKEKGFQPFVNTRYINISNKKENKLESIQVFRGLAAIIVVLHHITASANFYFNVNLFQGFFRIGWSGVDFFFVLSGFIITFSHFKDLGNRASFNKYLLKRCIRIYPSYWLFLLISIGFFLIFNQAKVGSVSYLLKCIFLIPQNSTTILGVSWSLCFEIIFYLLFAVYIWCGFKSFIIGLSIHLTLILYCQYNPALFKEIPIISTLANNFNLEFIFGCIISIIFIKAKFAISRFKFFFITTGFLIFILGWYCSSTTNEFNKSSFNSRVFYGIGSGLIILGAAYIPKIKKSYLSSILLKIGNASYILYLAHPIILAMTFKTFASVLLKFRIVPDVMFILSFSSLVFFICITFSVFFYNNIEKRLLKYLNERLIKR